jgi:hypothetical protein
VVHQVTEVSLPCGLKAPNNFDLIASRKGLVRYKNVFILLLVPAPQGPAWGSALKMQKPEVGCQFAGESSPTVGADDPVRPRQSGHFHHSAGAAALGGVGV